MSDIATESRIYSLLAGRAQPMVLATVVSVDGSSPGKLGFKLLLLADGTTLGTVGGGSVEQLVIERAREMLGGGRPHVETYDLTEGATGMWCGGRATVYFEPVFPATTLWIFGFGHLGREVHRMAEGLGYRIRVLHDEEVEGVESERFDWSSLEPFPEVASTDHVLLLTLDAERDLAIVERLASSPPAYVGVVGSRTKGAKIRKRLEEGGLGAVLPSLHVPVGVPIGARTPAEIAVSILAELVSLRSREPGGDQG
jgi:xanthine dehydrogenase accessory factor